MRHLPPRPYETWDAYLRDHGGDAAYEAAWDAGWRPKKQ